MTNGMEYRDPGEVPVLDWVDKNLIDIDPTYQRGLDEARVQRILEWFSWDSFGAIVVAPAGDGRFHCTDGQHRLAAAVRHPMVSVVPAIIVHATGVEAEAGNFIALNRDRKNVSPLEMYWAELAAKDPEAMTVAQVCERAGVTVLRYPPGNGKFKPRDLVAISALRGLIDRRGAMRARQILEVLANADLSPVTANQIKAAEALMLDEEFADQVEPEAITDAIRGYALVLEDEGKAFAVTHRVQQWKALASVWFRRCRKKRKAAA